MCQITTPTRQQDTFRRKEISMNSSIMIDTHIELKFWIFSTECYLDQCENSQSFTKFIICTLDSSEYLLSS